jgi:hypothetical protein
MIIAEGNKIQEFIPENPVIISNAIITMALSAIGSNISPNLLSWFHRLAKYPSNQSETAATRKRTKAIQSANGRLKYKNIMTIPGAATKRITVNILGKVQIIDTY